MIRKPSGCCWLLYRVMITSLSISVSMICISAFLFQTTNISGKYTKNTNRQRFPNLFMIITGALKKDATITIPRSPVTWSIRSPPASMSPVHFYLMKLYWPETTKSLFPRSANRWLCSTRSASQKPSIPRALLSGCRLPSSPLIVCRTSVTKKIRWSISAPCS